MKNLRIFKTDQRIELNSFDLNKLRCLNSIEFQINDKDIKIEKLGNDQYLFSDFSLFKLPEEKLNLNQLIRWCDIIKNR